MRFRTVITLVGCALLGVSASAQTPAPSVTTNGDPVVYAGLFARRPDGSIGGFAVSTGSAVGDDFNGIVYLAPCGSSGASSFSRMPAAATDVWRLGGRVLTFAPDAASVELTWQRIREGGRDVELAVQAGRFELRQGDRTTLEAITIPARGKCPERTASLDVAFTRRPVAQRAPGGGVTSVTTGTRTGGGGGGVSNTAAAGPGVAGAGGGIASVRAAISGMAARRLPTADLWLVHTAPGRDEASERLQTEVMGFPRAVTFAPINIQTSAGVFTVSVECFVEDGMSPEGEPKLFVSANRKVSFAPSTGPVRDTRPVVEGSVKTAITTPGPDETLSFELPDIQYPGAPAVGDRFAIRLRLTKP